MGETHVPSISIMVFHVHQVIGREMVYGFPPTAHRTEVRHFETGGFFLGKPKIKTAVVQWKMKN